MSTVSRANPTATVIATQPGEVRVRLNDNTDLPRWYPSVLVTTPVATVGTMVRKNQEDMIFVPEGVDLSVVGHNHDTAYAPLADNLKMQNIYVSPDGISNTYDEHPSVATAYFRGGLKNVAPGGNAYPIVEVAYDGTGVAKTSARSDHNHDSIYYTEAEVDALIAKYRTIAYSKSANQTVTAETAGTYEITNAALVISGLVSGASYRSHVVVTHRVSATTGSASFGFNATSNGSTQYLSAGVAHAPSIIDYRTFSYSGVRTIGSDGLLTFTPAYTWSSGTITVAGGYIAASVTRE